MKNYKSLIVLFFILIGLNLSAQSFEKRIDRTLSESTNGLAIELLNGNFIFTSSLPNSGSYYGGFSESIFYLIDSNGLFKDSIYLPFSSGAFVMIDSVIYGSGTRYDSSDTTFTPILYKINPFTLDTLEVSYLSSSDSTLSSTTIKKVVYCNCFTEVGVKADTGSNLTPYVRQFDSNLAVLNYKEFSSVYGPQSYFPNIYSFLERTDKNGIALIGSNLDSFNTLYDQFPVMITFLDGNLNRDSLRQPIQLTSASIISGGVKAYLSTANYISLSDSTYLFAGNAISKGHFLWGESDIGLLKMDTAFNLLSSTFYGLVDTLDGAPIGMIDKMDDFIYVLNTTNINFLSNWYLSLTRLDKNGNVIWNKFYKDGKKYEAKGILTTADGGALILADMFDINKPNQPSSGMGDLDIYILKVDSNGNQTSVGIAEGNAIPENNFLFYPNPVEDQLTIRKVNQFGNYQLFLFDSFGKQVLNYNWVNDQAQLNLSHLKSGIYVYLLVDEKGRSAGGKLLKM